MDADARTRTRAAASTTRCARWRCADARAGRRGLAAPAAPARRPGLRRRGPRRDRRVHRRPPRPVGPAGRRGRRLRGVLPPLPRLVVGARRPLAAVDRPDGDDLRRPRRPRRLEHVARLGRATSARHGWWDERIVGGFMAYWVYQHLGNLSPEDRDGRRDATAPCATAEGDAGPIVREFAFAADREVAGARWSYRRDLGRTRHRDDGLARRPRARARRAPHGRRRGVGLHRALDARARSTTCSSARRCPRSSAAGMHYLEAWNEAVCEGAWGSARRAAWARSCAGGLDLEHWAAFGDSLRDLEDLLRADRLAAAMATAAPGQRRPPLRRRPPRLPRASRVHGGNGDRSPVYQAVCSPLRNPLDAASAARSGSACRGRPSVSGARSPVPRGWRRNR